MLIPLRRILILLVVAGAALGPATRLDAAESDDQFAVAVGHYDHGRWKLAIEELRAFLEKYPHDRRAGESVFLLGEALLQTGQFDDARRQFQSYTSREPRGKYARAAAFRLGEAAYLAGDFEKARPDLVRFLSTYPGDRLNAFVLPYLGDIALAGGDAAAAAGYFRDGLSQFPSGRLQDDCRIGLARALEKQNQAEEAQRLYLAVAGNARSPLADAAQYHLGALQYNAGRYEQAIASFSAFDQRLAASPWRPNAQLGHGLAQLLRWAARGWRPIVGRRPRSWRLPVRSGRRCIARRPSGIGRRRPEGSVHCPPRPDRAAGPLPAWFCFPTPVPARCGNHPGGVRWGTDSVRRGSSRQPPRRRRRQAQCRPSKAGRRRSTDRRDTCLETGQDRAWPSRSRRPGRPLRPSGTPRPGVLAAGFAAGVALELPAGVVELARLQQGLAEQKDALAGPAVWGYSQGKPATPRWPVSTAHGRSGRPRRRTDRRTLRRPSWSRAPGPPPQQRAGSRFGERGLT